MADTLTITDNRTGKQYDIPISEGAIHATDLRQIRTSGDDFGMMTYDPAYQNTASCRSRITFIDGDKGVLLYGGYPIEQLAEKSTFLDVAYLLLNGELPTETERRNWIAEIASHTHLPAALGRMMEGLPPDAHPMGAFVALLGALSTYYPDSKHVLDESSRQLQIKRLIAQAPGLGAYAHRHRAGQPFVAPDAGLSYPGTFLQMLFKQAGQSYTPHPVLERALDVLFILHADHEQNCSTNAMRRIGSSPHSSR